jgi:iron(III) transport system ATP-binding protein
MAALVLEHLSKSFGRVPAVHDLTLHVRDGELLTLVGPSGCGKSTTLRLIAGLEKPSSGAIAIGGRNVNHLPPAKRNVAITFQDQSLYPHMTVRKNLAFGLRMRRWKPGTIKQHVAATASLLGLTELLDRKPGELSGGEVQRAALGRAIIVQPHVLLLDEPLSNLDATLRLRLRGELRAIQRLLRMTTIFVTHDQEEALTMADRIVVMNQGVIEQVGTPTEVYRKPASAFVADFVGTTNFLPAVVVGPGQVRFGKIDLACELDVRPGAGHDVTLAIRPEDVVVRNVVPSTPNTFTARVAEIEFLGSFCRVGLAIDGADPTLVADFSINVVRDLAIAEGKQMLVALPPERLRVFPRAPQKP